MGNPPFEDVSSIKNGGFPLLCFWQQLFLFHHEAQVARSQVRNGRGETVVGWQWEESSQDEVSG